MRSALTFVVLCFANLCGAQVLVDRPLRSTSSDVPDRQIDGLAGPEEEGSLITLRTARDGAVHWAQVGGTTNAITLTLDPAASAYVSGMLVRFLPSISNTAPVTLNVDGLGARKLLRSDLLPVGVAEVRAGSPVEAQFTDSVFILMTRGESDCPPGYLYVNAEFCFQQGENNNQSWPQAVRFCSDRGARLCTWDEYYHACTLYSASLTGAFDDWEWFDDTADHTHTAVQGGRWTCQSERSVGVVGEVHASRCCYRLR